MTTRWKGGGKHVVAVGFLAGALFGQGAANLDNVQTRVTTVTAEGAQPAAKLNRVLIFLDGGKIGADAVKAGDVAWLTAGHGFKVEGPSMRIVEVEIKGAENMNTPVATLSNMDAVKADPAHYKVEFENSQVRVLRVHYGPQEKGAEHEHMLNRVVCYLNDQGAQKAGDVRISGPAKHTEENKGDQPAERIAVELK